MKIEEMSSRITYIKCPDYSCKLWYDNNIRCELNCPNKDKLKKLIKCWNCNELMEFDINRSVMRRLDHQCKDGSTPLQLETGDITILRENIEK